MLPPGRFDAGDDAFDVGIDVHRGNVLLEAGAGLEGGNADLAQVLAEGVHRDIHILGVAVFGLQLQEIGDAVEGLVDPGVVIHVIGDVRAEF